MLRPSFVFAVGALLVAAAVSAAPPTTYYRSIGIAPDYSTGTITAVSGETSVVGSLDVQWKTENRGQGDAITFPCPDPPTCTGGTEYTILSVDAENELTLTETYTGATTFAESYTISRKFTKLNEWEDCIEATVTCPNVISADFITDDRKEVGVVYKDSVYFMNTGGEQLQLDTVITDAVHSITLTTTPPNRHHGVLDTGVILDNGSEGIPAIRIEVGFVTIEWIELHNGGGTEQIFVTGLPISSKIVVHNVLFHDEDNTSHGFHVNDDEAKVLFFNNILYGLDSGVRVSNLQAASGGLFEFYHNTFWKNARGLHSTISPFVRNDRIVMNGNLAHTNSTADFDALAPTPHSSSGKNWSGDTTGPNPGHGPGGVQIINPDDIKFVSTVFPEDFHIQRGSIVEDNGASIAAVTDDIDGRFRFFRNIGADEAGSSSANPVKILTAKSATSEVKLEWQHPDFGPMNVVEVWRDPSTFPLKPGDGELVCTVPATPGTQGRCPDLLLLTDGLPHSYSAFVLDFSGNYSKEKSVIGLPFDTGAAAPEWTYAAGAATLEPAGVRGSNAFVVSNDRFFHAMQGGKAPTAGEWPLPPSVWAPYRLPAPVQHRPVIISLDGSPTALLGAQDGRVYAVDIETGRLVWKSQVLGLSINAAPAALVAAYGATGGPADRVFVGTSDPSSNSLFVLDLMTGDVVEAFDDGSLPSNIGAVTGVAVKYPSGPVFFTSDNGSGGGNRNVWSIDVSVLPATPTLIWSDNPGPIDAGPTLYQNLLFVGSRAGDLIGYDDVGPAPPLWVHPLLNGALKAPIFPVFGHDTLLVSTATRVHSVQFTATGTCGSPPCTNWTHLLGGVNASPVLFIPGTTNVYVGDGVGNLTELTIDLATPSAVPAVQTWSISSTSGLGGPAFSISKLMLYVSDTSGKVHGIPWPIP